MKTRLLSKLLVCLFIAPFIACGGSSPAEPVLAGDTRDYTIEGRVTEADEPTVGIPGVLLLIGTDSDVLGEFFSTETDPEGYYSISFRRRCPSPGITIQFIPIAGWEGETVTIPCEPLLQTVDVSLEPS